MPQENNKGFAIYAVSDATGRLAYTLALAASRQFPETKVELQRRIGIDAVDKIHGVVQEVKNRHAVILFTMVSQERRRQMLEIAHEAGVVAMDIMGPALDMMANYFHKLPSDEPGLQYKITKDYFKRTEAVEFTVRHDDGDNLETIGEADLVILGISRATKTPLAIYLAYRGYRCATIPVVKDQQIPQKIYELDAKKLVGLIPNPERLVSMRANRLKKLGRAEDEVYAQEAYVHAEIEYSRTLFEKLPGLCVIDTKGKAIEEIAAEIITAKNYPFNPLGDVFSE